MWQTPQNHDEQEHSAQISNKTAYYPHIALIQDLENQHGDPVHPQNLINCSLYHCRAIMKFSSKSWWRTTTKYQQTAIIFQALWDLKPPPRLDPDPVCHQNLITCSFYHSGPLHKISLQSVHNFLSNVDNRQRDKQTNTIKNIISLWEIMKTALYIACNHLNTWQDVWNNPLTAFHFQPWILPACLRLTDYLINWDLNPHPPSPLNWMSDWLGWLIDWYILVTD